MATKTKKTEAEETRQDEGGGTAVAEAPPAAPAGMVRLRSRHENYRVGDVRFELHQATVTEAQYGELVKLFEYGQGKDFWRDSD